MSVEVLTLADAARMMREAVKDRSYIEHTGLGQAVDGFLAYFRTERGKTDETCRSYEYCLAAFAIHYADLSLEGLQAVSVSPEFGHRFAGLCDGESCFVISLRRDPRCSDVSYGCTFTMALRADDLPLLQYLRDSLDIGSIFIAAASTDGDRRQPNPTARWDASSKLDCLRIVSIIDEYPLWSKKAADYEVWREAVLYWNAPRRYPKTVRRSATTTRVIQAIDWSPLAELHGRLRALRRYKPFEEIAA